MSRYLYNYMTAVHFSNTVRRHALLLRCQPAEDVRQQIIEEHVVMPDTFRLVPRHDVFGNRILYGSTDEPHSTLQYVSTGIVEVFDRPLPADGMETLCRYPSPLTMPTGDMAVDAEDATAAMSSEAEKARALCAWVHRMMTYQKDVTSTTSSAADAYRTHQGVCQDYAHLMITLCRLCGLPARYVCGFLAGLYGETHAWVEVFDGSQWLPFDPTNGVPAEHGYLKIAHGRDAADCSVSRGVIINGGMQQTLINVNLSEIV